MMIDGEERLSGDDADYWIMWKAQHQRQNLNVYFKGEYIDVGGRTERRCSLCGSSEHSHLHCYGQTVGADGG